MFKSFKAFRNALNKHNDETGLPSIGRMEAFGLYLNIKIVSPFFDKLYYFIISNFNSCFNVNCGECSFYRGVFVGYAPVCALFTYFYLKMCSKCVWFNRLIHSWVVQKIYYNIWKRLCVPVLGILYLPFQVVEGEERKAGVRGMLVGTLIHIAIKMTTCFMIHNYILHLLHLPTLEVMLSRLIAKTSLLFTFLLGKMSLIDNDLYINAVSGFFLIVLLWFFFKINMNKEMFNDNDEEYF